MKIPRLQLSKTWIEPCTSWMKSSSLTSSPLILCGYSPVQVRDRTWWNTRKKRTVRSDNNWRGGCPGSRSQLFRDQREIEPRKAMNSDRKTRNGRGTRYLAVETQPRGISDLIEKRKTRIRRPYFQLRPVPCPSLCERNSWKVQTALKIRLLLAFRLLWL
jgi:hypothetical protein